jgi:hypothetical protein
LVTEDTTNSEKQSITYLLQTTGFVQELKIRNLVLEMNPIFAFDVELTVGFDPDGMKNPACQLTVLAAGWYQCGFGLHGTILTIRAHKIFFEMFKIAAFSNSQIEFDL